MRHMTNNTAPTPVPVQTSRSPWVARLEPRAGTRIQLFSAAMMWLMGASILLIRGVMFLNGRWIAALAALALVIGVAKSRIILDNYARKAVKRIDARGRACYFGFFSVKSWLFILVMMGGGVMLRHSPLAANNVGRDVLAVLYIAVGSALAIADRVYWRAALAKTPVALAEVENETD